MITNSFERQASTCREKIRHNFKIISLFSFFCKHFVTVVVVVGGKVGRGEGEGEGRGEGRGEGGRGRGEWGEGERRRGRRERGGHILLLTA